MGNLRQIQYTFKTDRQTTDRQITGGSIKTNNHTVP